MSTGRTDYTLPTRKLEHTPTRLQVQPHEGFHPETIRPRAPYTLASDTDRPDPLLAKPAAWTTQALCLGDLRFSGDDGLEDLKLACAICPVKDICLTTALEEERWESGVPLNGDERTGIRGGLTPRERVALMFPRPARCRNDLHDMTDDSSRLNWQRATWECKPCMNARKRARRAEGQKVA